MTFASATSFLDLLPATAPTLYFIGVTTGQSSIRRIFPRWALALGLGDSQLRGIDLPVGASPDQYRRVVDFIASDPLSVGALVTTHKIDLFQACRDQFDVVDPVADLMGETSCLSKTASGLACHAKDPISSGLALDAFIPTQHFRNTGAEVLSLGAGGSAVAISWYLTRIERGEDRPSRFVVTDRSEQRLHKIRRVHEMAAVDIPFEYVLAPTAEQNDAMAASLPPGSLVINATGLGKDAPGSPLSNLAEFPPVGLAWDLNYRGSLLFLDQARSQAAQRSLHLEDGWTYFLHGWTRVVAEVFHIDIPSEGPDFEHLAHLARMEGP